MAQKELHNTHFIVMQTNSGALFGFCTDKVSV